MSVLDIDILMSNQAEDAILVRKFIMNNYWVRSKNELQIYMEDGGYVVDFDGELRVDNYKLERLTNDKFRFGKISVFNCSHCDNLTSLEGAPVNVNFLIALIVMS